MRSSLGTTVFRSAMPACTAVAQRIDDTAKLDEQAVTRRLDETAVVLGNFWIHQFAPQRFEAFERAFLVRALMP